MTADFPKIASSGGRPGIGSRSLEVGVAVQVIAVSLRNADKHSESQITDYCHRFDFQEAPSRTVWLLTISTSRQELS